MTPPRTVTISLPPELARRAERTARTEGRSRSELFREALRQYLDRRDRWDRIFVAGEQAAARLGLQEEDVAKVVVDRRRRRPQ